MIDPTLPRCAWATANDPTMQAYHDTEWGVPEHDDTKLFEMLTLEGAQAGLSWRSVLMRRDAYREAYHGFDIPRVAAMTDAELEALIAGSGLIRNRLKIYSVRENAKAVLALPGSLDAFLWSLSPYAMRRDGGEADARDQAPSPKIVMAGAGPPPTTCGAELDEVVGGGPAPAMTEKQGHRTLINRWTHPSQVPATTPESDRMSKTLRKAGFRFVGSTICYAFMQATGMVDDHLTTCFRHRP